MKKLGSNLQIKDSPEISNYRLPADLLWQPDFIFSKNDFTYLVLIKSNNSILPSFLHRISKIPKGKIVPLIIFEQKLKNKRDEQSILSLGISLGYFIRGKLFNVHIKRKRPEKTIKSEIRKKLKSIDIFISSKQDIDEREFIKARIHLLRDIHNYPFFTHLIEYDKYNINQIYKYIDEQMGRCEWIIIIVEDQYSPDVSYEIRRALKIT